MNHIDNEEWDVEALMTALDSPFTSAKLLMTTSVLMSMQILELDKLTTFYEGENIYGVPRDRTLWSLISRNKLEGFLNDRY